MADKVTPIASHRRPAAPRRRAPAPPAPPPAGRQLIGGSPGETYQPRSTASTSFPIGGVIIIGLSALIILQLLGGDLAGRILSWFDHWKSGGGSSSSGAGAVDNTGRPITLAPATPQQVGGPLGVGLLLPINPGGQSTPPRLAPATPSQTGGPLGVGLLLPKSG